MNVKSISTFILEMKHDREINFHSWEQEMANDRDNHFNVQSGKQKMTQCRERHFYSGEHSVEQCSLPRWRVLRGVYVRPMGSVYEIFMMSI